MRRYQARQPDRTRPARALNLGPDAGHDLISDAAFIALSWFDDYLDRHPIDGEIRDDSVLPFPKDVLIRAFEVELGLERDERIANYLIERGLKLAFFASGIGPRPVRRLPALRLSSFSRMPAKERIAHLEQHHRQGEIYHRMMADALIEMEILHDRFTRAHQTGSR